MNSGMAALFADDGISDLCNHENRRPFQGPEESQRTVAVRQLAEWAATED